MIVAAESFLFSKSFEVILVVALAVITVMLFTGHGSFLLQSKQNTKKRTPEEERYMGKQLSYVTFLWLVAEIMLYFFGGNPWVTIVYIVLIGISLAYLIKFFKNHS